MRIDFTYLAISCAVDVDLTPNTRPRSLPPVLELRCTSHLTAPKTDPAAQPTADLRGAFRWLDDRTDDQVLADPTGWWADPQILQRIGPAHF